MKQEKNLTEAEIMKEIETLLRIAKFVNSDYVTSPFEKKVLIAIQDLINRKNAENERLNFENLQMIASIKGLKDEAIKEFANLAEKRICEKVNAPIPTESWIVEKCIEVIYETCKETGCECEGN